jgi:hypothetical protein
MTPEGGSFIVALDTRRNEHADVTNRPDPPPPAGRYPRLDFPRLAVGALASAALSVALATLFAHVSGKSGGANIGPTSATVGDAFSTLLGAALGLAVGSGLTALFVRRGLRMASGLVAGLLVYVAVLLPIVVATRPSDMSFGEALGIAFALGVPLGLVVLIGSIVGARFGSATATGRRGHAHHP